MKIVIDITDEMLISDIKNHGLDAQSETDKVIINALYNGTVIPDEAVVLSKEVADKMFPPFYKYVTGVVKENDNDT